MHYFNKYFEESFHYNQILIKSEIINLSKINTSSYIIIKLCHDTIYINNKNITFTQKNSYDFIKSLLPYFNISKNNVYIEFIPSIIFFLLILLL